MERGWGARSSGPCKGNNTGNDKLRQAGDRGPERESARGDLNRIANTGNGERRLKLTRIMIQL